MSAESVLQLEQVVKRYGDSFALSIERLEVFRGEMLCLLGPTGAGKSTLLRLASGLEEASQGQIMYRGQAVSHRTTSTAIRRRMAMVHQRQYLLTGSVRTNVEYGLRIRGIRHPQARSAPTLARLGLDALASQSAHTLSGGQTQLVGLARALVTDPEVLFLDEPTAHLDPARVAVVEEVIAGARAEQGLTVVWTTHNLYQARRIADRVGLLWDGQLIEVAATRDFFESPVEQRTADFVAGRLVY